MTGGRALGGQNARVFLFLQGPSSSLFAKLAARLSAMGHTCLRINLNPGDWLFWRRAGAASYRGPAQAWQRYLEDFCTVHAVSDIVLLGEERPYHQAAVAIAKAQGIEVTVIEMGYLRPDWLTVERDGMSSNSRFPNDPDVILKAAAGLEDPDYTVVFRQSFWMEALFDLAYNLPNVFLAPILYPGYRRHALFHPLAEYAGWIRRMLGARRRRRAANAEILRLRKDNATYFLYPLQLETDYQLRAHSPYRTQGEAIEQVVTSFGRHAPEHAKLVVKVHPLDNGLIDWAGMIDRQARSLGISERVVFIDGGDAASLLAKCAGQVTVNSTMALHGLRIGVPAKVLGSAIYDVAGMTSQEPLDDFWCSTQRPDPTLTAAFYRLLAASIQVRGNFYSRLGTEAAAAAIATRLDRRMVNLPGGDSGHAPRVRPSKKTETAPV